MKNTGKKLALGMMSGAEMMSFVSPTDPDVSSPAAVSATVLENLTTREKVLFPCLHFSQNNTSTTAKPAVFTFCQEQVFFVSTSPRHLQRQSRAGA
jgi:hypothetical protein